jgi:hypothetical protein
MQTSIAERLASRLGQKLAKRGGTLRSDFVVADYRVLPGSDNKSAKVLIQYDEDAYGVPTKEEVISTLNNLYRESRSERPRVMVDPASVVVYPKHQAVACQVEIPVIRRPFSDIERFRLKPIVAGTVYLGEDVSDTWTVAKGDDNSIYIERVERDDIEKILRERSKAHSFRVHAGRPSLTLARVEASTPSTVYSVGDQVQASHGGKLKTGEILGMAEGGAHVRFRDGSQALLPSMAIHKLVEAADAAKKWNKEALKEYYRKAYGYDEAELEKLVSYIG